MAFDQEYASSDGGLLLGPFADEPGRPLRDLLMKHGADAVRLLDG